MYFLLPFDLLRDLDLRERVLRERDLDLRDFILRERDLERNFLMRERDLRGDLRQTDLTLNLDPFLL